MGRAADSETVRQLVLAAIALKRYQLLHHQAAPDPASLVPEFLPEGPIDYMDGQPLRYRLNKDGRLRLYSIGHNQQDDGGDPAPTSASSTPGSLLNGRDIVWPDSASPEEIAVANRIKKN